MSEAVACDSNAILAAAWIVVTIVMAVINGALDAGGDHE